MGKSEKKEKEKARDKGRYEAELKRIRELSTLSKMLKKGDVESALLSEIERDSESGSVRSTDELINKLMEEDKNAVEEKNLEIIEKLPTGGKEVKISKKVRKAQKKESKAKKPAAKAKRKK